MKKLVLLLCLLMVLSVFAVACATPGDGSDTTPAGDTIPAGPAGETTPSGGDTGDTEVDIYANLPTGDFKDFQFDIITVPLTWLDYENHVLESDTPQGEPVNDEIYNRNLLISEQLGVTIAETVVNTDDDGAVKSYISNQVLSGEKTYDMISPTADFAAALVKEGYLADMGALLNIDLEKPWWDYKYNDSIKLGKNTYVAFGDLSLVYKGCVLCMGINNDLITDHGLEDPFELYAQGNWTYDKVYEMCKAVSSDEDGDGVYNSPADDIFGIVGNANQIIQVALASGATIMERDPDGVPVLKENNELFYNVFESLVEKFVNSNFVAWATIIPDTYKAYDNTVPIEGYLQIFNEGRSLFTFNAMGAFHQHRSSEVAYKIIDVPKYDTQYEHVSSRYKGSRGIAMVGGFNDDELERNAAVIENLAAYNHQYVIPKYIEITLYYKYAKDQASLEMLQTMLSRQCYTDLLYIYNWGGFSTITNTLIKSGRTSIASSMKAIKSQIEKEVEYYLEDYE